MISYALYRFECALRSSAVLGFIGIETIGLGIRRSFNNLYYGEVWTQLYVLIALVIIVESIGNLIRRRLRNGVPRRKEAPSDSETALRKTAPKDHFVRSLGMAAIIGILAAWNLGDILLKPGIEGQRIERLSRFLAQLTPDPVAPERPVPTWEERKEAWNTGSDQVIPWLTNLWKSPGQEALTNTVAMSVAAIILAGAAALLLVPWGARTLASAKPLGLEMMGGKIRGLIGAFVRGIFILTRAVPEYLYAFLLVGILGPSAWPLVFALALHNLGILGRLWSEVVENRNTSEPREILRLGGSRLQAFLAALLPLSLNRFILFFFYRWESCVREATVLGMLGISSLGYYISIRESFLQYDQILFFALLGAARRHRRRYPKRRPEKQTKVIENCLRHDLRNNLAVHIGEPHVPPPVSESLFRVIDSHKMEHVGMEIMHREFVLNRMVTVFVGRPINCSAFDPTAGHPDAKPLRIVIPAISSLRKRSPPKFTRENNQGGVEQSSLFEIFDKRTDRLIDRERVLLVAITQPPMLIPAISVSSVDRQLDKANPLFDKPAGHKTLRPVCARVIVARFKAIHFLDVVRLLGNIGDFRNCHLHPIGHLVIFHRCVNEIRIGTAFSKLGFNFTQKSKFVFLKTNFLLKSVDVAQHNSLRMKHRRLMRCRKETTARHRHPTRWDLTSMNDNITREVLILASQTIGSPGSHAGTTRQNLTTVQ